MLYTSSVLAALVAAVASGAPAVNPEIIEFVNSQKNVAWTAHESPRFADGSLEDVSVLCGTIMAAEAGYLELPEREELLTAESIPTDFNSATAWPKCSTIGHIRDQSSCGSCWAFGSTEALNDRTCIETGDATLLSPTDTTACCGLFQCGSMGCNGGQPSGAWNWFKSTGVVSGGDYNDDATCLPYSFPPCAHHVNSTTYGPCPTPEYSTPSCSRSCASSAYGSDYGDDKRMAKSSYSLRSVEAIQKDIMTYGPVTGAFSVYEDFPMYQSGVYHHVTGKMLGGHAIKIYGWGVEDGTPYWLCANSWNESWGDAGSFKIKRGNNECGIEGQVVAGQV